MKRLFFLILLLGMSIFSWSRTTYTIYKLSGDVLYKARFDSTWTTAQARQLINLTDSLYIPKSAEVEILQCQQDENTIFRSVINGKIKMYDIISAAKKPSSQMFVIPNVNVTKASNKQIRAAIPGVVTRDYITIEKEMNAAALVCNLVSQSVRNSLATNEKMEAKVAMNNDSLSILITNTSGEAYFLHFLYLDIESNNMYMLTNYYADNQNIIEADQKALFQFKEEDFKIDPAHLIVFGMKDNVDFELVFDILFNYEDFDPRETPIYDQYIIGKIIQ